MRCAVISLTEAGRQLSCRVAELLPGTERYCFYKHTDAGAESFTDLSALTGALFARCDAILFIGACGIAVRMIAPHLRSKASDPAVLVLDAQGKYVISLLSGHIGGANALAGRLADALGAQAVITTATDIGGVFSPDSFAVENDLLVADLAAAKEIAAAALSGEPIGLVSDYPYQNLPPELTEDTRTRTGLYIGTREILPFPVTLRLVPKNLVLGIGCKRGTAADAISRAVDAALASAKLPAERIRTVSTIDRKADEPGLLTFCESRRFPLVTYTAQELMQTAGDFTPSAFVQNITGADNVCERSAVRCSGGTLLVRKTAVNGVTCAVAEQPVTLDFI